MARFTLKPNVGENVYETFKAAAAITDNDIGKPVKIGATDEVALCADGDEIYGFIASVEPQTADGKKVVGVLVSGRKFVILDGNAAVGTLVEAAANTNAGVANAGAYGLVSVHVVDDTNVGTLKATIFAKNWKVISGTGLNGATVLIEKV
jgi:hypothetical protein